MILVKYQPDVIGITGSVGKTSAKEAVYSVLKTRYNVRRNVKNYNNEIGLPLAIIGVDSPGKSLFGWLGVFLKALRLFFIKDSNYPKILILEMAADKPGDIEYLTNIVRCKIGVITLIGPVHLEFFGSLDKIQGEKSILIKKLIKGGWAVLNNDDEKVKEIAKDIKSNDIKILSYGFDQAAIIRAQETQLSFTQEEIVNKLDGISFKLSYAGSTVPVFLPKILGQASVYAALAGVAVGIIYGFNLVEIAQALKDYQSPKGRMNLIFGIKRTLIVDDTYNASPQSTIAAVNTLASLPLGQLANKYAVLGDMLELGSYSEAGHREVGETVAKSSINKLIVVGERARDIARGAASAGMAEDNIFHFDKADEAGKFIQDRIKQGDIILVKGSQGMRMEKIVKEIMAEPLRAKELLVRQGSEWQDK